jgi:hypothetical protein
VVANHVAGVLTQEAFDALAELLRTLHVDLLHPVVAGGQVGGWCERRDLPGLLVVEGNVGDQVSDHRERSHRSDGDRLGFGEGRHPGHAQQSRAPVHLGAAGATLSRLAIPPHGQIRSLGRLQPVDYVQYDLTLVDLDREVL